MIHKRDILLYMGSGLDVELGYPPYIDYDDTADDKIVENAINCNQLDRNAFKTYKCIDTLVRRGVFKSIITSSPWCLYRCIDHLRRAYFPIMGCVDCTGCNEKIHDGNSPLRIGNRIPRRVVEKITAELSGASELLIIGVNPVISPYNMIPLIAKWYGIPVTIVTPRPINPYSGIADEVIRSLGTSYIKKICRAINIIEQY